MRLIDAGYFRKMFLTESKYELTGDTINDVDIVLQCIDDCPEIDTGKHGHWIDRTEDEDGIYEFCSACGMDTDISHYRNSYRFCPNCGAMMDLEVDKNAED